MNRLFPSLGYKGRPDGQIKWRYCRCLKLGEMHSTLCIGSKILRFFFPLVLKGEMTFLFLNTKRMFLNAMHYALNVYWGDQSEQNATMLDKAQVGYTEITALSPYRRQSVCTLQCVKSIFVGVVVGLWNVPGCVFCFVKELQCRHKKSLTALALDFALISPLVQKDTVQKNTVTRSAIPITSSRQTHARRAVQSLLLWHS